MVDKKAIFDELKEYVHKEHNSNFHFDSLDWSVQVWIFCLCDLIDKRLEEIEKNTVKWEI